MLPRSPVVSKFINHKGHEVTLRCESPEDFICVPFVSFVIDLGHYSEPLCRSPYVFTRHFLSGTLHTICAFSTACSFCSP
jgi:hypothetical protein